MSRPVLTGVEELDRILRELETKTGNRIARATLGRGITVLNRIIKNEIPHRSIKRSVGRRNKRGRSGRHEAKSGFGVGKAHDKQAPHAHLLAAGTEDRYTGSSKGSPTGNPVQYRGRIVPSRWIQQALAKAPGKVRGEMIKRFRDVLEREVAKLNPRRGRR